MDKAGKIPYLSELIFPWKRRKKRKRRKSKLKSKKIKKIVVLTVK